MPRPYHAPEEVNDLARLVVYIAAAPGAGKTRRLLTDARRLQAVGKRVAIGWIDTRGRADLEQLCVGLPRIATRPIDSGTRALDEFDLEAALLDAPDVLVLDELAHDNLAGSLNGKRWEDALALRERGITVLCAFNIAHLDSVAPVAQELTGCAVRDIVPKAFLRAADEVIALDASPQLLRRRELSGVFSESRLAMLRELLLRTIDDLTIPTLSATSASVAVAIVMPNNDTAMFLHRTKPVVSAMDLALEVLPSPQCDKELVDWLARDYGSELLAPADPARLDMANVHASLIALPNGPLAARMVNSKVERDILIVDASQTYLGRSALSTPLSGTIGDRMRVGYGKLTVYLGAAAGAGKTMAMLDRGHQLAEDGIDVVIGFVETHGRAETAAMAEGLELIPRKAIVADGATYTELDREALIARAPAVALIDELAHTNAPGSLAPKRYLDVLAMLRAGINVITTLNVQHLEDLNDAVARLTGTIVRETLPDGILPLADEVILIDASPQTLRERLHAGKIYPPERIEYALAHFFRTETLASLRELALREALRAETRERISAPFERLLLSVVARPGDLPLVRRASRLAARLETDFTIAHVAEAKDRVDPQTLSEIARIARSVNAEFIDERADDAAKRLIGIARSKNETTIAVGGTLRAPRWPQRKAFARRLLDAGARELLVFARLETETLQSVEGET